MKVKLIYNKLLMVILEHWESKGVQNILLKHEQFITPNGAEGLKIYGYMQIFHL